MKTLILLLAVAHFSACISIGGDAAILQRKAYLPAKSPRSVVVGQPRTAPYKVAANGTAPAGCKKLSTDADWPTPAAWSAALPGVTKNEGLPKGTAGPDYLFQAKTVKDVQDAVKFCATNNIRLSIINSGHDYLGRNNAASGLRLDMSLMGGIKVLESFTPTADGAESPGANVNVIVPTPGTQAAVTLGGGVSTQQLNNAIHPSKLVTVGAGHGEVTVAGGYGQGGGHSPISPFYGLGADQFLELKVVTADGDLKIVNKVSNPDLFWALRGGSGGTFGVVVEATVKAYPDLPIKLYNFWFNTTAPPASGALANASDGLWDAYGHLAAQFPALSEKQTSGYFYIFPGSIKGNAVYTGNASDADLEAIWKPILTEMQSYPGLQPYESKIVTYPAFTSFFDDNYGPINDPDSKKMLRRHGPGGDAPMGGDMDVPEPFGLVPANSHLLGASHLKSPDLVAALKPIRSMCLLLVGGGKVLRPDDDTSVVPAWRKAYAHVLSLRMTIIDGFDDLKRLASDMGAYNNEAFYEELNWKQTFWGSNYAKLSQIKSKYDPDTLFWVTPGINADQMQVTNGRVCKRESSSSFEWVPPMSDNQNKAVIKSAADIIEFFGDGASSAAFPSAAGNVSMI